MAKCHECNGKKVCSTCNGSGEGKKNNPHPSSNLVNKETGDVKCLACFGRKFCNRCKGTGEI